MGICMSMIGPCLQHAAAYLTNSDCNIVTNAAIRECTVAKGSGKDGRKDGEDRAGCSLLLSRVSSDAAPYHTRPATIKKPQVVQTREGHAVNQMNYPRKNHRTPSARTLFATAAKMLLPLLLDEAAMTQERVVSRG